ncbi:hypothetical protein N8Z76_00470 [Gammaproteobacteria bacterium]|nr:hypothetical protein [Gammaproteobacteria bacterium]
MRKSKQELEEIMWIVGGVDSFCAVTAHLELWKFAGAQSSHTPKEKVGRACWRWDPNEQQWDDVFGTLSDGFTDEKLHAVQNWLVNRGYAEDEDFLDNDQTMQPECSDGLNK